MLKLHILHTPPPSDRSQYNLLILNDGQDLEKLRVKETMDSLYKAGKILPLVIIGVEAGDRMKEYGVTDKPDYLGRGAGPDSMMPSSMMNYILMQKKIPE